MTETETPGGRLWRTPAPLLVLILSLLVTSGVWAAVAKTIQERDRMRFDGATAAAQTAIEQRMETYVNMLRASAGLFAASNEVTRSEWSTFVSSLQLNQRYPGTLGLGYTERIPRAELAAHERTIRAEGFPTYHVWPTTPPRDEYFSVVYLEPFDWRNQRAFGYDMYTDPIRREAMVRARDTGLPAMSGRVTLVQETNVAPQAGFLLYVPVYRKGMPLRSVEERRAALQGFVYSPFRADDLFQGIFGRQEANPLVDFEIFDDSHVSAANLLHDHNSGYVRGREQDGLGYRPRFERVDSIVIAGRPWTLFFSTLPAFEATGNPELPLIALLMGLLVTGLLVWITWALATGRARALAMARDMTSELRQADRAKDEFLSVISHELRTPLNFIMGFASILDDEVAGPLSPKQHDFVGKILGGVDRMLNLVNDLLDYAKIQAGKFTISKVETPFAPLVEEVKATLQPMANRKAIALSAHSVDPGNPYIDGSRLMQVLTNLVDNAIKFTPEGGKVHVEASREGDRLRVEVTDTGIGIAEEDFPKLFTRFRQLDMSSTREAGGTGLGLSIAKAIVEAHGGSIGVRSRKGDGSTFWFTLPMD